MWGVGLDQCWVKICFFSNNSEVQFFEKLENIARVWICQVFIAGCLVFIGCHMCCHVWLKPCAM
jgi:succinate dehydrogenase/fumarate reductase cytochrome b subunit